MQHTGIENTPPAQPAQPAQARPTRGRKIAVASIAALGIAAGGVLAAEASFAADSTPSSTASGSASAPAAPGKGGRVATSQNDLDGLVTAASSSSVTVQNEFGTSRTFAVSSSTTVHSGPNTKLSASSLQVGQHVHVRATMSGSTYTATDIDVRAAHIDGTVTAISGDTVTVTDRDGFNRTIALSSSTTYTKDGATSSRSALVLKSVVRAQGKVDSDKTTLDASTVAILTKAPTPPAGGHGGRRGGGPGGAGGPAAPGGSPSSSGASSSAPSSGSGSGS